MSTQPKPELEPVLPHNPGAEKAVLGAVLVDNENFVVARKNLAPEDFFFPQHTTLFRVMERMTLEGRPIDLITVYDALEDQTVLASIGGTGYLASLANGLPKICNVEYHARIVKQNAQLREAIYRADAIKSAAFECEDIAEIQKRFAQTAEELQPVKESVHTVTAKQLCLMKIPKREYLLEPIITSRSMGELFSGRGIGKTFLAISMGNTVADGGSLLKFKAPKPARVLYVDGELDADTL